MTSTLPADRSNGYEAVAEEFIYCRTSSSIGAQTVREWARALPTGADVLDLGCGHGIPISAAILDEGVKLFGIDASPSLIAAFRARFPNTMVECSGVEDSDFFGRRFDGVVAWGLMFLLPPETQAHLIGKISAALKPGGRFLFTSPPEPCEWTDNLTGQRSVSLGANAYRLLVKESGMTVVHEIEDEGQNHYYSAHKPDHGEGAV